MIYLAQNIKYLRKVQKISQQVLADKLYLTRSNLAKYENGAHDPGLETLIKFSRYFNIPTDILLTVDLEKNQIDGSFDQKSLIMPVQVDTLGNDTIEIIPQNASAGYLSMYSDPEYIESLDYLQLPFLTSSGKLRAFPVSGDSMPPVIDGSYIIGSSVPDLGTLKVGHRYVFVSRDEGIVFKRLSSIAADSLELESDNPKYKNFMMSKYDLVEIWKFEAYISIQESADRYAENNLLTKISSLQLELETVMVQLTERSLGE